METTSIITKQEKSQDLSWGVITLSITLPKTLIDVIDSFSKMAQYTRDEYLALLIVEKLIEFHEEKVSILSYIKGLSSIFRTLKKGLSEYYRKEFEETENQKSSKLNAQAPLEKVESQAFEIALKLPAKIINCLDHLSNFALRTKEDLLTNILVEKLQWLERDEESLIDYIKDSKDFFRRLKAGINTFYNKQVL